MEQRSNPRKRTERRIISVLGCMGSGFLASGLGGAFGHHRWYDDTPKPAIWPPQWVFPLAWIVNYTAMGLALAEIWERRQHKGGRAALGCFALNFVHNLSFIPIVYRIKTRHMYVLMDAIGATLTTITTVAGAQVSHRVIKLMLPYVVWSYFTTLIKWLWWRMEDSQRN